jgi:hypothetical protein
MREIELCHMRAHERAKHYCEELFGPAPKVQIQPCGARRAAPLLPPRDRFFVPKPQQPENVVRPAALLLSVLVGVVSFCVAKAISPR